MMKISANIKNCSLLLTLLIVSGCTTVTIDQSRIGNASSTEMQTGKSVVVVGRRSGSDYETEKGLISCIGDVLSSGQKNVNVISEQSFVDRLYPWFEPRTAPVRVNDLFRLLEFDQLAEAIEEFDVQYLIWVDGSTQTLSKSGQFTCGLGATGISCFGFGTWDKRADYEATIWDYQKRVMVGKINGTADGTSYVPALVIPIPIIAPVQDDACKAIGLQLRSFFKVDAQAPRDESI